MYKIKYRWKHGVSYYLNGNLHRLDGPALEYDDEITPRDSGSFWFKNGKRHREDGPAMEFSDGRKEWFTEGKFISRENGIYV